MLRWGQGGVGNGPNGICAHYTQPARGRRQNTNADSPSAGHVANHVCPLRARGKRNAHPASDYPVPLLRRFGRLCAGPETGKTVKAGACGAQPQAPAFSF